MNIMITGCAGFIGSHVAEHVANSGHSVVGVDCLTYAGKMENMENFFPDIKFFKNNICSTDQIAELVTAHDVEWIINFAAETHVDNSIKGCDNFIHSNILGVKSLLEVCKRTGAKLFQISTDEVYGDILEGSASEDFKMNPKNPYSASKAAAEHFITAYANTYDIRYIIARPANNYGPRQHDEKLIPTIMRNIVAGQKIPIYATGQNIREWTYVKDTAAAILFILENSPLNQAYNISANDEKTNIEVVDEICAKLHLDHQALIEYVPDRPGHDFRYSINASRLAEAGFIPTTTFSDGIFDTIKFYQRKYEGVF